MSGSKHACARVENQARCKTMLLCVVFICYSSSDESERICKRTKYICSFDGAEKRKKQMHGNTGLCNSHYQQQRRMHADQNRKRKLDAQEEEDTAKRLQLEAATAAALQSLTSQSAQ
jgi:hypothetical protein